LHPGKHQPFNTPADIPNTQIFFFPLFDDSEMNTFEQAGSEKRSKQDRVLQSIMNHFME